MGYIIFNVTDNDAFNFFFSAPLLTVIIAIPMILAINVFKKI